MDNRRSTGEASLPFVVVAPPGQACLASYAQERGAEIHEQLLTHGAVLFRDFAVREVGDFEAFLDHVSRDRMSYLYRSTPRTAVGKQVFTATEYPPKQEILLHNENAYQRSWPLRLAFHCVKAASSGGQTTIADMRRVTAAIGPELLDRFERLQVQYVRHYREHIDIPWQTVFQTQSKAEVAQFCARHDLEHEWLANGTLRTAQTCQGTARHPVTGERTFFNQAHLFHSSSLGAVAESAMVKQFGATRLPRNAFFGDGSAIAPADLAYIRDTFQREACDVQWRPGDVVLLDNMRVAHGRRPFAGERRVLTALLDPSSGAECLSAREHKG